MAAPRVCGTPFICPSGLTPHVALVLGFATLLSSGPGAVGPFIRRCMLQNPFSFQPDTFSTTCPARRPTKARHTKIRTCENSRRWFLSVFGACIGSADFTNRCSAWKNNKKKTFRRPNITSKIMSLIKEHYRFLYSSNLGILSDSIYNLCHFESITIMTRIPTIPKPSKARARASWLKEL